MVAAVVAFPGATASSHVVTLPFTDPRRIGEAIGFDGRDPFSIGQRNQHAAIGTERLFSRLNRRVHRHQVRQRRQCNQKQQLFGYYPEAWRIGKPGLK